MHKSMLECIDDLEQIGQLQRIKKEIDPYLEMAAMYRQEHLSSRPLSYDS